MSYTPDGVLDEFKFGWVEAPAILAVLDFSDGFVPNQLINSGDWTMFSNSNFNASGRVVIRNKEGDQEFIIDGGRESADGDSILGNQIGQHMWIDVHDTPAPIERRLQEEEPTEPSPEATEEPTTEEEKTKLEMNHQIIGISSPGDDNLDHISFFKFIEMEDGTFKQFDFGIDVIQTEIIPPKRNSI